MKIHYDLHIHSALSPCADDDMTPVNIVGFAKLAGIDAIAIADHNGIANVQVGINAGKEYGVVVVPAIELQTAEDVHILCLFETFEKLKGFYDSIIFTSIQNVPDIFGNQLILDEEDNVVATEQSMLLMASNLPTEKVWALAHCFDGVAIPAHVDRVENGMIAILGAVTEEFSVVEVSHSVYDASVYAKPNVKVITNSDAHSLAEIGRAEGQMEVEELSPRGILQELRL